MFDILLGYGPSDTVPLVIYQAGSFISRFLQTNSLNDNSLREQSKERLASIHVAFGLSGNEPGFLSEFEVALKSVLLNAPLQRDLFVHVLADNTAFAALDNIYNKTQLAKWVTRNQIEIHSYNVTSRLEDMERVIMDTWTPSFPEIRNLWEVARHTVGTYFRLFAHWFLPSMAEHVLYMDTDVMILANLEELWHIVEAKPDSLFHWGKGMCACFVVMKVSQIDDIWTFARTSPLADIKKENNVDDQLIYISVNETHPNEVNVFPGGFDMTLSYRWQGEHFPYEKVYPETFMLHHNGNGNNNSNPYWNSGQTWISKHRDSWGLMEYYINLPWSWARFFAKSQLRYGSSGHLIKIVSNSNPEKKGNHTTIGLGD
ncbi:hypothetical protein ACHAW6_005543 [Cyclotella cf. meneghiniana]